MYRFRVDEELGILYSHSFGNWSVKIAERYVEDLVKNSQAARQRFGKLRALIDSRNVQMPKGEVMRAFEGAVDRLVQSPEDRIATIVTSHVWKQQTKRAYSEMNLCAFLSENAARSWLMGFAPGQSAVPVQMAG